MVQEFTPMCSISTPQRIASAHAVLSGRYGDVTRLARQRGSYRQALYREASGVVVALEEQPALDQREALRRQLAQTQAQLNEARQALAAAPDLGADRQAEFVATGQALGVSLSAVHALLAVFLRQATPSVPVLGRRARAAGRRAAATLTVLDTFSRARARQVAADELFAGRRPVLMMVEQDSLCWLGGRLAPSRDGPEWAQEFRQLPALEQVTRDGGQGLEKGLRLVNAERRQAGQPEAADQDDHFHLLDRGRRALHEVRHKAVRAFRRAERAERTLQQRRQGQPLLGLGRAARHWWAQAEAAWDRWAAHERAFEQLRAALRPFTPEGTLSSRAQAEAEVQKTLAQLTGPEWSRLRSRLVGPKAFTFLDRIHTQLQALPAEPALVQAALRVEGLRRTPAALVGEQAAAAARRGVLLAAGLVLALAGPAGEAALTLVRGVLRNAWRASSLVEGLNSVLRMQQARQRRLTPELLDLKRLHWNTHTFHAGRRKHQTPYQRLGLVLPNATWWELLKIPPEQLRQQLSQLNPPP
jgi:hypothetical protein